MRNFTLTLLLVLSTWGLSAQQLSTLPDVGDVTGAVVNESSISNVYYVDAQNGDNNNNGQSPGNALKTIFAAKDKALVDLKNGIPTKIQIAGGTYRESLGRVDFGEGPAKDALFVIEGAPGEEVIISGSKVFTDWTSAGSNLYEHPWDKDWNNLWINDKDAGDFTNASLLAYRAEMIFVDGEPLRQEILEEYTKEGDLYPEENYTDFNDPAQTLSPGTFGVAQRDENGNKLYIRPEAGIDPANAQIEVAVERQFVSFGAKNGLVLRNLTVQHFANTIGPGYDFQYAVYIDGIAIANADGNIVRNGSSNVLVEECTFRWNNQFPLRSQVIDGYTLRNSVFEYNGGSGQDASFLTNSLFENNTTNFNNWRNFLGGATKWFLSGFKHQTNEGQIMRGHTAVGNLATGCWWDISNKNQLISEITSVLNYREGFFYEISEGPMVLEKSLIALNALEGSSNFRNTSGVQTTFRNNIIYSNVPYRDANDEEVENPEEARQGNFRTTMYPRLQPGDASRGVDEAEVASAKMTSLNNVIMGGEQEGFTWYFSENTNAGQNFLISDYQGDGNYFYHASGSSDNHFRAGAFDGAPIRDYEGYVAWAGDSETNSQFTDPGFTDATNLDFRFTAESPLKAQEGDYLAKAVDPQLLQRCQEFWDWVGYERTVPGGATEPTSPEPPVAEGTVTIRAQGDCGDEVMVLKVDGQEVDRWTVTTAAVDYTYANFSGGEVSIEFINDRYRDGGACEDSNLSVDFIQVCGTTYQTETAATVTASCCTNVKDKLYTNGNFNFGTLSCNSNARTNPSSDKLAVSNAEQIVGVEVYPNPATEQVVVHGPAHYRVTLYDLRGVAVQRSEDLSGQAQLEVASMRPGVYVLYLVDTETLQRHRQRLVVE